MTFNFLNRVSGNLQRVSLVAVGAIALGLGSCATTTPTSEAESPDTTDAEVTAAPEDPLEVMTTFLPITQFTTAVAGDRAEVTQLLPTNVGPHDYQAKPGDAQALSTADVLVKNGLEMEFFLDDMIANAENADLTIIDSSELPSPVTSTVMIIAMLREKPTTMITPMPKARSTPMPKVKPTTMLKVKPMPKVKLTVTLMVNIILMFG